MAGWWIRVAAGKASSTVLYCTVSGWRATAANFRPSEVDPLSPLDSSRPELTGQRTPARLVAVSASTAPAHLRQSARAGMGPPLRVLSVRVRACACVCVRLFPFLPFPPLSSRVGPRVCATGPTAGQPVIQPSLAQPSRAPPRQPDNQPASQAMPGQGKPVAEPNSTRI